MKQLLLFAFVFFVFALQAQAPNLRLCTTNTTSLSFSWSPTATTANHISWGKTLDELTGSFQIPQGTEEITIPNLEPATIYQVRLTSTMVDGTILSETKPFITSSLSSGEMKVYFNFSIDDSFSNGSTPQTTTSTALEAAMIEYILSATETIDICMYNINRDVYVNALKQAASNGITVRYIAESSRTNWSLHNTTLNFPVLYAESSGIMHNKFLIIDNGLTEKSMLVTGAYNFTNSNLYKGYNNMISIQDQSLTEIYTTEFEEMWGGSNAEPNLTASKTGEDKTDNTPHTVFINGIKVESYFSPSDHTTSHIVNTINTADHDFRFGLLAFTNDDIEDAIFDLNVPIQGLIEDQFAGTATNQFQANGIPVYDFDEVDHFLHHKYGIIDIESTTSSDPTLITGSHNWTYSAEYKNDENTLIIHDADIANIYLQEFEERWKTIVAIDDIDGQKTLTVTPNPASDFISFQNNRSTIQTVSMFNCLGIQMNSRILHPNETRILDIQDFPQGMYFLVISGNQDTTSTAKVLIKH